MNIRDAVPSDLPDIVRIYNAAVPTRLSTADTEPITVESRLEWFNARSPTRPLWVLEVEGAIAAWISLSSFYGGRPAYGATAEISIYIAPEHQRQGYGTKLIRRLIEHCPQMGITTLLAMYFDHNEGSQRMFSNLGFQPMGHLTDIALLDGVQRGLIIAAYRIPAAKP